MIKLCARIGGFAAAILFCLPIALAQNGNLAPVSGSSLLHLAQTAPDQDTTRNDPDRPVRDVDNLVCKELKKSYESCEPKCGADCKALYEEARQCKNVKNGCRL
jgi:hypothetical protein